VNPAGHWHNALPDKDPELAGHVSHVAVPINPLYVPASHAAHAPASAPVNPAEHWHSALPDKDSALAGQVSHPAVPPALLNVPAVHALHATSSEAAVCPGKHAQSVNSLLPAAEVEFKGQAVQFPDPVVTLNVPASHAAQLPDPAVAL
jgi:hypothetical protein